MVPGRINRYIECVERRRQCQHKKQKLLEKNSYLESRKESSSYSPYRYGHTHGHVPQNNGSPHRHLTARGAVLDRHHHRG